VRREHGFGEILLELFGGQVSEQHASHAGAVGRKTAADVEVHGHDTAYLSAGDIDDVFAVECGNGEGLAEGCGHTLEDGLGRGGEGV